MSKATRLCRLSICLQAVVSIFVTAGFFTDVQATIVRYLEVEALARLSTDVIHGRVLSMRTYWDEGHTRIYTAVRVQVAETFKGAAQRGEIVTVTQFGGELDGLRLDYSGRPQFGIGEAVVLFTKTGQKKDLIVVGMKQGKLRVVGDEVVRDFSGLTLLEGTTADAKSGAHRAAALRAPVRVQTRMSLSELRQRLAKQ